MCGLGWSGGLILPATSMVHDPSVIWAFVPDLSVTRPPTRRAHIKHPNTSVAVFGVGGLGHLALQYAHKMGAEVTAISGHQDKVRTGSCEWVVACGWGGGEAPDQTAFPSSRDEAVSSSDGQLLEWAAVAAGSW
jgi:hypothetical protein